MNSRLSLVLLPLFLLSPVAAQEPQWADFAVDWNRRPQSPASLAGLLDRPAGKDGFLRTEQGHLVQPAGGRFRIWGVNMTGRATVPAREAAPQLADHLARCGVNCVRFHFLDRLAPNGLIDASRNDTRTLDPGQLERLDFFIAELKQRGIYSNLNLNVGRTYKAGDGVPDCELLGFAKALTYFHPRLLELQKEYARQLLTHRNPHTGNEYRHEPAVALVELVNENSIVESWFSGRLLGKHTGKNPGTWTDIPARFEQELSELYNRHLNERFSEETLAELRADWKLPATGPIPRLTPGEFAAAPQTRFFTEASFYMELERRYFEDMRRYLRDELGVQSLLLGTSDHNHGKSGYPLLTSTSLLDVVDGHVYWQHPKYLTDTASGRRAGFEIGNTPMVNEPQRSTVVQLSRSALAGQPYTVSEVNHPFPNAYACEGIPILAAYAALHDWDGVFWYTLGHEQLVGEPARAIGHFDLGPDPVKMTQLAAGALLFLRSDVRPATQTVTRSYTGEQVLQSLRLPWSEAPYFTPGFPLRLPLIHATRIASLDGPPTGVFEAVADAEAIVSDTGELTWSGAADKKGLVQVNTPRSQTLVGFVRDQVGATRNLVARPTTPFCALTLSSLDDQPIAEAGRLLLTATAQVANTGMRWNAERKSLDAWGTPPARIEVVQGTVVLKDLASATAVKVEPLDGVGQLLGPAQDLRRSDQGWEVPLGTWPTTWYLITVAR